MTGDLKQTGEPLNAEQLNWLVQTLGTAHGKTPDEKACRRAVREALRGRVGLSAEQGFEAIREVARVAHLEVLRLEDPSRATPPFATVNRVVLERRGDEVHCQTPEGASWVSAAQGLAGPGPWLSFAPLSPLEPVAHHTPWGRLLEVARLERDDLWLIVVYAGMAGLLTVATPVAVQALVASVAFGTLLQPIFVLSTLLLAALAFQAAMQALQSRVVEAVQQRLFVRTALDLAWRLPRVRSDRAEDFGPAAVNQFLDIATVQKTAAVLLTDGISTVLQVVIGLLVLSFYHPALLGFALLLLVVVMALVLVPARKGLATSLDESRAKHEVAAWLEEIARAPAVFRGAGAQWAREQADVLIRKYVGARRSHFRVWFEQSLGALAVQVCASVALLGLGGALVVRGQLTLGQLVAAELIVTAVAAGVGKLGKLLDSLYDLLTSLDKVGHLVDLPVDGEAERESLPGQGPVRVEVRGVKGAQGAPLELEVAAGAHVAITGAEGHALAEWLVGLRAPANGVVVLNGVEVSRGHGPELHREVALVRRGEVFAGSILDNVCLGRSEVTSADARAALDRVGLLETVRALPEGLDTVLSHDGAPLTAGQLAQVLLARAIAGLPRLLVVDESLEVIEPVARERCVAALTRPRAPWTLVALVTEDSTSLAKRCELVVPLAALEERRS